MNILKHFKAVSRTNYAPVFTSQNLESVEKCTTRLLIKFLRIYVPIPVSARSKTWVCGRSPAEIVSSNPAHGTNVCLL